MNANFTKREKIELEECKKSLIISCKVGRGGVVRTPRINHCFFWWCQHTKQPYVQITLNRTTAEIFMDLPNGSGLLDEDGARQFHALCSEYGFPQQEITCTRPTVEGIPLEMTTGFARHLVQIGHNFCMRYKHN